MYPIVLLGLLALASAAPSYHHHQRHHDHSPYPFELDNYLNHNVFDTSRFWEGLRRDMMELDKMLAELSRRFPMILPTEKIEGNEYIITIPLAGYEEKDIVVKAKKGLLVVQAVHKYQGLSQSNYLDVRALPDYVNEAGSWTFDSEVLKITFPLLKRDTTDTVVTEAATDVPHSREELEPSNEGKEANYARGDLDDRNNEIPKRTPVEATTYAVDLKDEVELLPAQF